MKIIKYSNDYYSVNWMMFDSETATTYLNAGLGKSIRWLYVLQGELTIEYKKNNELKTHIVSNDEYFDLNNLNDIPLTFKSGSEDCCISAIVPLIDKPFTFDVLEVDKTLKLPSENKEKVFIPLTSPAKINNHDVKLYHSARVLPNKNITIETPELDSMFVVFTHG